MGDTRNNVVTTEAEGRIHAGSYEIDAEMITVHYGRESKRTQVGNTPVGALARMLLGELVRQTVEK